MTFHKDGVRGDPSNNVMVITAYGMPARISAAAQNPDDRVASGVAAPCVPDTQYPGPCVMYLVVKDGASVTVTAGPSLAGYWPALETVRGGDCDLDGNGQDQTCTRDVFSDVDIVAVYYGGESPPGLTHYRYPTCPTQRVRPPAWAARCP